jgi:hypothetical protein
MKKLLLAGAAALALSTTAQAGLRIWVDAPIETIEGAGGTERFEGNALADLLDEPDARPHRTGTVCSYPEPLSLLSLVGAQHNCWRRPQ